MTSHRQLRLKVQQILLSSLSNEDNESNESNKISEATAASRALMCDVLGLSLTQLLLRDQDPVSDDTATQIIQMANRMANGEPLQYVTGRAEFCGLNLVARSGALIPRPETEELVQWAAQWLTDQKMQNPNAKPKVLDIGTGTGCIALALKNLVPWADVYAIDISDSALVIAQENAQRTGLDVTFRQTDILSIGSGNIDSLGGPYDLVLSNPPYVMESERATMTNNVLDHEPWLALFVPDNDPLLFYRKIAYLGKNGLLNHRGKIFVEINEALPNEVMNLYAADGYEIVEMRRDFCNKPRMVSATLSI